MKQSFESTLVKKKTIRFFCFLLFLLVYFYLMPGCKITNSSTGDSRNGGKIKSYEARL